ncbi:hypothetical protein BH09PLA1_BH09PLA1_32530 [soil metagenome]
MRLLLSALAVLFISAECVHGAPIGGGTSPGPTSAPIAATDRRMPPPSPPDQQVKRPSRSDDAWQIPPKDIPEKMRLVGFESRILGERVSYLIYLPTGYDFNPKVRFPVVYVLPGMAGDCREVGILAQRLDTMINRKQCLPMILVGVQGVFGSMYTDTRDGVRPIESVIVNELVQRVDATFRTIPRREARAVEGFYMGGYGAAFLGFKYPDVFGVVSMFAPPIAPFKYFQTEAPQIADDVWGNNPAYFDDNDPFLLVERNVEKIRGRSKIRIYCGAGDPYHIFAEDLHAKLNQLNIEHEFELVPGVGPGGTALLKALKGNIYPFWAKVFPVDEMFKSDPPASAPATQPEP